jgi:hypothetical protein
VAEVPRYAIPVEVIGPTNFLLIAVWSKGRQDSPYVEAVVRAVEMYRDLFSHSAFDVSRSGLAPQWKATFRQPARPSTLDCETRRTPADAPLPRLPKNGIANAQDED